MGPSDRRAAARIVPLYREHAAAWIGARGETLLPEERVWIDRFVAAVKPGGRVLDLGCGHGYPIAAMLLARGLAVTGIDASEPLLAHARATLPAGDWRLGDLRALELAGRFDGILAWYSSFHLTGAEQAALIARLGDLAAPGAPLMITTGPHAGIAIGEWQGEPLFHASLSVAAYAAALDGAGFDVLTFAAGAPVQPGPSVWLARRRQISPASGLDGSA